MISLKRNTKGALVDATGLRSRESSIYRPNQTESFRISRSKFNDFLSCKRCFYLDRVRGIVSPGTPGWTLNQLTDDLLKKEFDLCRARGTTHRILTEAGLGHITPYTHPDLDLWRDSLRHGLEAKIENSSLVLHGGVDDVWFDRHTEALIVVDFKSQASSFPVTTEHYLAGVYHQGYKIQLDVYAYLLNKMGFSVSPIGYFYVCNADRSAPSFEGTMVFAETLVPYEWNIEWIDSALREMVNTLNSDEVPEARASCENCAYARQRALAEVD